MKFQVNIRLALIALWVMVGACNPVLADPPPASSIPRTNLIQPADLAALIGRVTARKPLILQVGFRTLYAQAHIPGSEYVGAASEDEGLRSLHDRVAMLPKDSAIVIYCGCCPWSRCPNVGRAFAELRGLGFNKVKVLYIAEDFGTDWVNKGYPVTKGS
ncbi:MAG: rhodanese-like domain-containing protein [Gammaproteobacteria bacterium]